MVLSKQVSSVKGLLDSYPRWSVKDAGPFFQHNVCSGVRSRDYFTGAVSACIADSMTTEDLQKERIGNVKVEGPFV